jgi:predicted nucleic acid-binding protein
VGDLLRQLEALAEYVPPVPCRAALPDPGDMKFLECATAGLADCVVTGNRRHFPRKACRGVSVVTPAQFVSTHLDSERDG